MALSLITEGATSAANDLNQVVNLLNGTTTNTQVTVNGPVAAQLSPAPAALRYVGGVKQPPQLPIYTQGFYTLWDFPLATAFDAATLGGGTYYRTGDLSWGTNGGPIGVYNVDEVLNAVPVGTAGYVCRVHQAGSFAATIGTTPAVTCDTVDVDPRGMYKPSTIGSGGGAITIPFNGIWGFAGAIHGSGVNSMNVSWQIVAGFGAAGQGGFTEIYGNQISANSDNTHKYTGTYFCGFAPAAPGMQIYYTAAVPVPATFNIDVSGPDRTYLAVWNVT